MIDLEKLFKDHFDTQYISDDKLKKFSEDHLERLHASAHKAIFKGITKDTEKYHNNYFGAIAHEDGTASVRKSRTKTVDQVIKSFNDAISNEEGGVKQTFGKKSATYLEFFPKGITEYTNANKANLATLLKRLVKAGTTHKAKLGSGFVKTFTTIENDFKNARATQLGKIGEVSADKTKTAAERKALGLQLCRNLHFIAYSFPGDVKQCMSFFDQSIIKHHTTPKPPKDNGKGGGGGAPSSTPTA